MEASKIIVIVFSIALILSIGGFLLNKRIRSGTSEAHKEYLAYHLATAKEELNSLIQRSHSKVPNFLGPIQSLNHFNYVREECGISLKEIGTNEENLREWCIKNFQNCALNLVDVYDESYDYWKERLGEDITKCNDVLKKLGVKKELVLNDLGSDKELKKLWTEGNLILAKKHIDEFQKDPKTCGPDNMKNLIRDYLGKANAKPEDIGIKEEELEELGKVTKTPL